MQFKRTPDERFDRLVDYPFRPHYQQVDDGEGDRGTGWELSTLGHPCADLAYQCMAMRLPASDKQQMAPTGLVGLDLQQLGLPCEQEYVANRAVIPR